jgi:formylmethanofuran dehydrogenase subunit E
MGVKAAARAVREMGVKSTGMEEVLAVVETNSCFSDGVQMVTGCSFGNNSLIYRDFGKTAFTLARRTGEALRIAVLTDINPVDRYPEATALFKKVVKDRHGTPDDDEKLRRVWIDVSFSMLDIPDEELFTVKPVKINLPSYARISASVKCSVCGEKTMETRARVRNGQPVCLPCSGQDYYLLAGDGLSLVTHL